MQIVVFFIHMLCKDEADQIHQCIRTHCSSKANCIHSYVVVVIITTIIISLPPACLKDAGSVRHANASKPSVCCFWHKAVVSKNKPDKIKKFKKRAHGTSSRCVWQHQRGSRSRYATVHSKHLCPCVAKMLGDVYQVFLILGIVTQLFFSLSLSFCPVLKSIRRRGEENSNRTFCFAIRMMWWF